MTQNAKYNGQPQTPKGASLTPTIKYFFKAPLGVWGKLLVSLVFLFGTHFAFAQKGNRVVTTESVSPQVSNDSAIIEGEVIGNSEDNPPVNGKIFIKETKKEIYTDARGCFKVTVAKGKHTVVLNTIEGSGKDEIDHFVMQVKVDLKPQHHIKLKFFVDVPEKKK